MAGGSLALVSSIVQSPLGGFELRLFFRFLFTSAVMSGWSTEKLQVETRIKRRGRKALFKEPDLDAHFKGPGYPSWSFIFFKQQATSNRRAGGPIGDKQ